MESLKLVLALQALERFEFCVACGVGGSLDGGRPGLLRDPFTSGSMQIMRNIDRNTIEPGRDLAAVLETRGMFPGANKDVQNRLFRVLRRVKVAREKSVQWP